MKAQRKLAKTSKKTTPQTALITVNKALALQIANSEKRAEELVIANNELAFQNQEKENRASELAIANLELAYQNQEKENRASELAIANKELAYQNQEKENRASELVIANNELAFQIEEKAKRASELLIANKELESFTFISSHDLQEPLRKIQTFSDKILNEEAENLSAKGKHYFERIQSSALHMQTLINDLLAYSRTNDAKRTFVTTNLRKILNEVMTSLKEELQSKEATIELVADSSITVIHFQFKQLLQNLITNALKFRKLENKIHIIISTTLISKTSAIEQGLPQAVDYCKITVSDNGIGFDAKHADRIFELFQRLHDKKDYEGTGIGLTIVKKIVENHNGIITAKGIPNEGAQFNIYLPIIQETI